MVSSSEFCILIFYPTCVPSMVYHNMTDISTGLSKHGWYLYPN